jgi:D-sedoheptulose 7-phosphate isomerase
MHEPRVQQHFFESADLGYQAAESIARPIADAAQAIVDCLTAGGRVLVHGRGVAHAPATLLGAALTGRFERERPGLAALVLATDAVMLSTPAAAAAPQDPAVQQVRALGAPGDVLVAFALHPSEAHLDDLVDAAHEREMSAVVVTGRDPAAVALATAGGPSLAETDIRITIPHERAARVCELQLVALHALCDAVDLQLLGDADLP